jgi:hypothetical protein
MDRAGSEYFNEARALVKKKGGIGKLNSLERAKVDGLHALSGLSYYVASVAKYLGPKTGSEWLGSILSLPAGGARTFATKVPGMAKMAMRGIHGYEAGHLAYKLAKAWGRRQTTQQRKPALPPRKPFTQHPWSQISVPPRRRVRRRKAPPPVPRFSYLNQVKVADWMLQATRDTAARTKPLDAFKSPVERLKGIEKAAQARQAEQNRLKALLNSFSQSISKPQPANAHQRMRRQYGAKIDAIAEKSRPHRAGGATLSGQDWRRIQKFQFKPKGPMVPGPTGRFGPGGLKSRPMTPTLGRPMGQSRLRTMARPLMPPNRARPMMR